MIKRKSLFLIGLVVLLGVSYAQKQPTETKKPNILFIAVDDLRLQANLYGQSQMKTPNLDRLGSKAVVFERAFCSVPVCGASRASLLTGVRPTPTRFLTAHISKDDELPDQTSLPKYLKENGYTTISNGKVYHRKNDDLGAWSETPYSPNPGLGWQNYLGEEAKRIVKKNHEIQKSQGLRKRIVGPTWEALEVPDNAYPDGLIAEKSIADLKKLKEAGNPFFLAVGFLKPHLPFTAPKKYWNLYSEEDIELADNPFPPLNAPSEAMHNWQELRVYDGIPETGLLPDSTARKLIHGYYASVSYSDTQIGKLLDELERLGLAENTIIVLWGDHGWHLGEHTLWCKHANFDRVMNAPLMVKAPGKQEGVKSSSITEFVDIYPSLCELAGLPIPEYLDGKSFVPVLEDPNAKVKDAAFVRYLNGETVITEHYNYTEFSDSTGQVQSTMLYDLREDPKENENISLKSENKRLVKKLSKLLSKVKQTKVK